MSKKEKRVHLQPTEPQGTPVSSNFYRPHLSALREALNSAGEALMGTEVLGSGYNGHGGSLCCVLRPNKRNTNSRIFVITLTALEEKGVDNALATAPRYPSLGAMQKALGYQAHTPSGVTH